MKIKIFKEYLEYASWSNFDYDFFVTYFAVKVEPAHAVPILRLFKSYEDAKDRGFSTITATTGWAHENFYRCDEENIEEFCKSYLDIKLDLSKIPTKHQLHNPIYVSDNVLSIRKSICSGCDFNINNTCALCGCDLIKKMMLKKRVLSS